MPKSNSQQKSTPDARTCHQQVGAKRRRAGGIAWGKDRPKHTAGASQNKGTEKLQRRSGPSPLEVGGRGEGKGANSAPEKLPLPTLQTGPQFLS